MIRFALIVASTLGFLLTAAMGNLMVPLLRSLREFPKAASKASDMYLKVPGLKSPTL